MDTSDRKPRLSREDVLRARVAHGTAEKRHESLEAEIGGEMASALSRAGHKVREALERAEAAGRALDDAVPADRPAALAAYEAERQRALTALWELKVHREALGLRRHDDVNAVFRVPPRRS